MRSAAILYVGKAEFRRQRDMRVLKLGLGLTAFCVVADDCSGWK
jgi:hypothetical protein